jgi:hypothetical protein
MTNEERDLITRFIERVAAPQGPSAGFGGSVPNTGAPPPPPVDPDADALLADLFTRYPEARYRVTQMAFVQEHALVEAQNRMNRLQWELQQARQQVQAVGAGPRQPGGAPWGAGARPPPRGLFGSLFGGAARPAAPQYQQPQQYAPPPQYPPNYNPGLFQQQGPGFFGSALRTAAGVAGGMVAADALMSLFSGHQGGGFGGGGFGGTAYAAGPGSNPWTQVAAPQGGDPYDVGGAPKDEGGDKFAGPAVEDQSSWTPAPDPGADQSADQGVDPGADQGGWQQADDSGWDQAPDVGGDAGWSDPGGGDLV